MSSKKEMAALLDAVRRAGWRVELTRRSNHYRITPPDPTKPIVFAPSTPSDRRSVRAVLANLRQSGWPQ